MDFNSIVRLFGNQKDNPALNQLLLIKTLLDKLPKDEQVRIMQSFIDDLKSSVKRVEEKQDVKTEE